MKITEFLKEFKVEMTHVTWPTRQQAIYFTSVVVLLSLAVALFLGLSDFLLRAGISKFF